MLSGTFRRAVANMDGNRETIAYSVVPILLGVGGAVSHFRRDWKRFASVFAMFLLMGIGLVVYLNMPDPEPREREYIFLGAYTFFALWIGGGAAALISGAARGHAAVPAAVLVAALCLVVPIGLLQNNYFERDRSGDFIAHDYARNILDSCEPDAMLFTNGDNDTYPLWFLQYVQGFRRDVRVVNLSLLKTPWYVKQLRDLDPMLPIRMTNAAIEGQVIARPWPNRFDIPLADSTIIVKAEDIPITEFPVGNRRMSVLESHTFMIWYLVAQNNWQRPIYFAVTVPERNMGGLRSYLSMEGMVYRLVRQRAPGQFDADLTSRHLLENYRYTGIADPRRLQGPGREAPHQQLSGHLRRPCASDASPGPAVRSPSNHQCRGAHDPSRIGGVRRVVLIDAHQLPAACRQLSPRRKRDSAILCLEELIRISPREEERNRLREDIRSLTTPSETEPEADAQGR